MSRFLYLPFGKPGAIKNTRINSGIFDGLPFCGLGKRWQGLSPVIRTKIQEYEEYIYVPELT